MPFLSRIKDDDKVPHVLSKFNTGTGRPLLEFHEALLRGDSPVTVQERELMATYVSGINASQYCCGAHTAAAKQFGVPETVVTALIEDVRSAPINEKLKAVLAYIRKLTLTPTKMTQSDADAVFAAGRDERALYDAVQVCCLYNFMNRFVEGLGLTPRPDQFDMEDKLIKEGGYAGMAATFGIR
jgi:uncharacterized peroxidase-related enzyme